jgi:hypothetical protein
MRPILKESTPNLNYFGRTNSTRGGEPGSKDSLEARLKWILKWIQTGYEGVGYIK